VNRDDCNALLRAVKEQPEDDLPRLILADWLEEFSDVARAEHVRVQCELARLERSGGDCPVLRGRESQLRATHAARWVGGLKRFTRFSTFERGLLFLDLRSPEGFLNQRARQARRSEAYDWVTGLQFQFGLTGRLLRRLLQQAEVLAGLTHLQLYFRGEVEDFVRFIQLPQLQLLAHLDLSYCVITDEGVAALARSPHLGRLTALGLSGNAVTDAGIQELASSPYLCRLTTLTLSGNPIGDEGAEMLARSPNLANLKSLSLFQQTGDVRLGPAGIDVLRTRFGDGFRFFSLSMPPLSTHVRAYNRLFLAEASAQPSTQSNSVAGPGGSQGCS
jgi:uncharacterized protein (TIGR02996 family)